MSPSIPYNFSPHMSAMMLSSWRITVATIWFLFPFQSSLVQVVDCTNVYSKALRLTEKVLSHKLQLGEDFQSSYIFLSNTPFLAGILEIFALKVIRPLVYFTSSTNTTKEEWHFLRDSLLLQRELKRYSQKNTLVWSFKRNLKDATFFVSKCLETLSHIEQPLVMRNRDRNFILTASHKLLEGLLESSEFGKIKYKVGISLFQENGREDTPVLKSVCFHCLNGSPSIITLEDTSEVFEDYTLRARGFPLRVSSPSKFPFLYRMAQTKDGKWIPSKGMFASVLFALAEKHNYTFALTLAPGGGSGIVKNGSWNGVVADLIHDHSDVGLGTSPNPARAKIIHFSSQFTYCMVGFVTGLPEKNYSWRAIYKPFSKTLWLYTFLFIVGISVAIKVLLKFKRKWGNNAIREDLFDRHHVNYVIFSLVGQGVTYPTYDPVRFLCAVWFFSGLIINTMYVSKLTELLAFPEYGNQPKTFNQLVMSKGYKWGQDSSGGNLYLHFQTSTNPVFQEIFQNMESPSETVQCFQRAMAENFACIAWTVSVRYVFARNLTANHGELPILISEETTLQAPVGIAMQKQSIYERNMNVLSAWILNMGLTDYWYDKDMNEVRQDRLERDKRRGIFHQRDNSNDGPSLLILDNLKGTFYLLALGLFVSAFVFLGEFLPLMVASFTRPNELKNMWMACVKRNFSRQ